MAAAANNSENENAEQLASNQLDQVGGHLIKTSFASSRKRKNFSRPTGLQIDTREETLRLSDGNQII